MKTLVIALLGGIVVVSAARFNAVLDPHAGHAVPAQSAGVTGQVQVPADLGQGVVLLPPPAGATSGMYSLVGDDRGRAYLSWIDQQPDTQAVLRFSRFEGGAWAPAREIARAVNWFVNWADHPSISVLPGGELVAHWLVNNDGKAGSYGYGIRIARSADGGATWREVFSAGTTNTRDYSGFVAFLPSRDGFSAAYLTPLPGKAAIDHVMGLKVASFDRTGRLLSDVVADADTCTCCTTTMVNTARGPLVAYRDHQAGEVRDISVVRLVNGRWSEPRPLHRDGWVINACPTNGPVLAARDQQVAAAWFTAAGNEPRVKVAFSADAGATFRPPVVIDGGRPIGWPSIVLLDDGSAVVAWLESLGGGAGEIRVRRVHPDGRMGQAVKVAGAPGGRSAGIPQMVRTGDRLLVAWRHERMKSALAPIPAL